MHAFIFYWKMENKAATLVSSLIAGTRCKNVVVAGKAYVIKSPTVKILCRVIGEFAQCGIDGNGCISGLVSEAPDVAMHILKGLAYAIVGEDENYESKAGKIAKELSNGSPAEIVDAVDKFMEMSSLSEVFRLAASAMKYAEAAAITK